MVPVAMEMRDPGGDVGTVYVIIAEPGNLEPVAQFTTDAAQRYAYLTTEVAGGSYLVIAGTDRDDDGLICDAGEACGVWPAIDSRRPVYVNGDQTGIDIRVSLDSIAGSGEPPLGEYLPGGIPRLQTDEHVDGYLQEIFEAICELDPSWSGCP